MARWQYYSLLRPWFSCDLDVLKMMERSPLEKGGYKPGIIFSWNPEKLAKLVSMCFLESKGKHFQVPCCSFSGGKSNFGCFQKSVVILGNSMWKIKQISYIIIFHQPWNCNNIRWMEEICLTKLIVKTPFMPPQKIWVKQNTCCWTTNHVLIICHVI